MIKKKGKRLKQNCNELWGYDDVNNDPNFRDKCKIADASLEERLLSKKSRLVEVKDKKDNKKKFLISSVSDLVDIIDEVPKGELITNDDLGVIIKERYNMKNNKKADQNCQVITFFLPVDLASIERNKIKKGLDKNDILPYWRIVDNQGRISRLIPDQKKLLELEGHKLIKATDNQGRKRWKVKDYEKKKVFL